MVDRRHKAVLLVVLVLLALEPRLAGTGDGASAVDGWSPPAAPPERAGQWLRIRQIPEVLPANVNAMQQAIYRSPEGVHVMLTVESSRDHRRRFEMHYPEVCHRLRGDEVLDLAPTRLDGERPIEARTFAWTNRDRSEGAVAAYWFVTSGEVVSTPASMKLLQLRSGVLGAELPAVMVRVDVIDGGGRSRDAGVAADFLHSLRASLPPGERDALFPGTEGAHS